MIAFSHFQLHILIIFGIFFSGVAEILHPLHLFPNPSMARTRRGHSFRPRVHPSSPPPAVGQSTPPTTASVAALVASPSIAPVPTALAPRRYDTQVGPTLPSSAHL